MTEIHREGDKIVVENSGMVAKQTIDTFNLEKQTNNQAVHQQAKLNDDRKLESEITFKEKARIAFATNPVWRYLTCCCLCFKREKKLLYENERMILFRFGRLSKEGELGPGRMAYIPGMDKIVVINKRDQQETINKLMMLSIDAVSYTITVTITFQIYDGVQAVVNIMDYKTALKLICGCLVRDACGFKTFDDARTNQKQIEKDIQTELTVITNKWGISVLQVSLSDFKIIPSPLKVK